jgi:hypothetical protein
VRLAADSLISLGWLMPPSDGDEVTLSASEVGVPRLHASCGPHRRPLPDAARTASVVACPRDSLRSADSRAP